MNAVHVEEYAALSWRQARGRLRSFLEEYLKNPPSPIAKRSVQEFDTRQTLFSRWLKWNLDIYVGAFGSTIAIFVVACLSVARPGFATLGISEEKQFFRSELAAAVILLWGCLFNIWVVARQRYSSSRGTDSLKRREIMRFLRALTRQEESCVEDDANSNLASEEGLNLAGTSLTDIYPVYRLNQRGEDTVFGGSWSRIPTLLLVQGDHIALQVGDIAPAACRSLEGSITLCAGERITLSSFGTNTNSVLGKLPKGRTTLPKDSDGILDLCNHMQTFVVLESPLEVFLQEPGGKL